MTEEYRSPFLEFLSSAADSGSLETDDVLYAMLPLMRQVLKAHESGRMAPLDGTLNLVINGQGELEFRPEDGLEPQYNKASVEALQPVVHRAVDITGEHALSVELGNPQASISNQQVAEDNSEVPVTRPVYLPGYHSWEQRIGHHDELTDIFSLGMLLGSLTCHLDFSGADALKEFVAYRHNLFAVNSRVNPVVASIVTEMTELNRHKRAQDLSRLIYRLENYRDQPMQVHLENLTGLQGTEAKGKRQVILSHLRDRLFEISRRNRLIYFKQTMQTLNLTVASVPLVMDYNRIKLEQLLVWQPAVAELFSSGKSFPLGKYLRFEDAPYIPGVLDKIISDARRDRVEFGFAQLRLMVCFLRWNNLKENRDERINSPLLLVPVELAKKKGVRDSYVLQATAAEAEVNPVLRHYLKDLYNLDLPETVELNTLAFDGFFEVLQRQIQSSEPGITLKKVDRPRIDLILQKARQRLNQYQKRVKLRKTSAPQASRPEYSYNRDNFRPLGIQLFLQKIRPTRMPLRHIAGAGPDKRTPFLSAIASTPDGPALEKEQQGFSLTEGEQANPYLWEFDLCSFTLGNMNYRNMTLMQDYSRLIENELQNQAFDAIFSLNPRPSEGIFQQLDPEDQHIIIPCDATQASAVAQARSGGSYIIQGPPGTGKSQTITNLIADYVARGKRVLFVCEKRAAIDVVFHRLKEQGLDELCCIIHDSQSDKKTFIQNLKQTYEKFLAQRSDGLAVNEKREAALKELKQGLTALDNFSQFMAQPHEKAGLTPHRLTNRLVKIAGSAQPMEPETEEAMPLYSQWIQHGDLINRLCRNLQDAGLSTRFAANPLRLINLDILQSDRPIKALESGLDMAETHYREMLDTILQLKMPETLWVSLQQLIVITDYAQAARFIAESNGFGYLDVNKVNRTFDELIKSIQKARQELQNAQKNAEGWKQPLSPDDTANALAQAQRFKDSFLRFLNPSYWKLRKVLKARYDYSRHVIAPPASQVLGFLSLSHQAQARLDDLLNEAKAKWSTADPMQFAVALNDCQKIQTQHSNWISELLLYLGTMDSPDSALLALADTQGTVCRLDAALGDIMKDYTDIPLEKMSGLLKDLRESAGLLMELGPILSEMEALPETFTYALRNVDQPLEKFEQSIGQKTLNEIYRQNRTIERFNGQALAHRIDKLRSTYRDLLDLNAENLRATVRQKFLDHVNLSSQSATQLGVPEKAFKKGYTTGRRELEHEFGKSMRYKSIRDLAAGESGMVIQDIKPIWLMSPLSVSDTLPLEPDLFDVVIFDEASQIPMEEAIPTLYCSQQAIIVGDEMQLPPTSFFSSGKGDSESLTVEEEGERIELEMDSDSLLKQSARNLPATMLAWHYRSRYETLISFSNAAFYSGDLNTIPDRVCKSSGSDSLNVDSPIKGDDNAEALLARSISFHYMNNSAYENRRNACEAQYIAHLVRGLLNSNTGLSIGIVAFSEAQQTELESALEDLAEKDSDFAARLEAEYAREVDDVYCGLFVKNLENVQGDERDIIIMSVCYAPNREGKMLMNFGPINQRGGEKRLNVIFSRAKHHMAVVSSIRHGDITNDYNDGANSLKRFLQYAEALSQGNMHGARHVLDSLNPLTRKGIKTGTQSDAVTLALADALRSKGYVVDTQVGQSNFRCDLAVRSASNEQYELAILVDTDNHYQNLNLADRYLFQPSILKAFGWQVMLVLTKDWYENPDSVVSQIEKRLKNSKSA